MFPGISGYPGNIGNMCFLYFGFFPKKTRAEISRRMHRRMSRDLSYETDSGPKTKTVSDPNFQLTAAAATAAASQQLSHLARALDYRTQGSNIPFGVIPHFDVGTFGAGSAPRRILFSPPLSIVIIFVVNAHWAPFVEVLDNFLWHQDNLFATRHGDC